MQIRSPASSQINPQIANDCLAHLSLYTVVATATAHLIYLVGDLSPWPNVHISEAELVHVHGSCGGETRQPLFALFSRLVRLQSPQVVVEIDRQMRIVLSTRNHLTTEDKMTTRMPFLGRQREKSEQK